MISVPLLGKSAPPAGSKALSKTSSEKGKSRSLTTSRQLNRLLLGYAVRAGMAGMAAALLPAILFTVLDLPDEIWQINTTAPNCMAACQHTAMREMKYAWTAVLGTLLFCALLGGTHYTYRLVKGAGYGEFVRRLDAANISSRKLVARLKTIQIVLVAVLAVFVAFTLVVVASVLAA